MPRDQRIWMTFPINFWMHPKIRPLSDAAFALWVRAVFWSSENATDAWLPASARRELRGSRRALRQLEHAGLIAEGVGGHWIIRNDLWRTARDYRDRVPEWMRQEVLERDGYECLNCASRNDLQMDHIYPWSLGGKTTVANLQTLCGPCNRRKGARIDGLAEDR